MIRKIVIEGVRTHEHTEIALGRLTCLVGPNGSGKSTVLEIFRVRLGERPLSWMRAGESLWKISFEDSQGEVVQIGLNDSGVLRISDEPLRAYSFRLESEVLRAASEHKVAAARLEPNGANLAHVLASWKLSDELRFETVISQLKEVVPALKGLRPNSTKVGEKPAFELLFDFHSASRVPAQAVSEGTLLALGLLTALHAAESPQESDQSPIVLLDDIDRGLHPDAQIELIKLLRQLAELKDLQIVMTTHSPYIVDALSPEEVCVLALDSTGTTRARQLSEIPGAERYRGMLSTGELWSSHGESWVLEEQAKSNAS